MEIENPDIESDSSETLLNKNEEKTSQCSLKLILIIFFGNIILIAICVIIIHFISKTKVNLITNLFNNYLKDLVHIAITSDRIKHLVKTNTNDKYQVIVDLEKKIFNLTWTKISKTNETAIKDLDKLISELLFPNEDIIKGISEDLVKILTQKEDYIIYQLLDKDHLKELNEQLDNNDKKKILEEKLKYVVLYGLINFPLQITYFSKNETIKNGYKKFIEDAIMEGKLDDIINQNIENYDTISDKAIYMVLGSGQDNQRKRMKAIKPFINITNTGLRVQPTKIEFQTNFTDDLLNYYTNPDYFDLIKDCFADDINDTQKIDDFINNCSYLAELGNENDYTTDEKEIIINYFNKVAFSVETANTFIEYLKLGVNQSKIHIIRLGEDKRRLNELLKYNKEDIYILYNVYDISDGTYDLDDRTILIKRATTEANVKALFYLKNEEEIFSLGDEDYKNLIFVSSKGDAERQLETFNIIYNIHNYSTSFSHVIWNSDENPNYNEARLRSIFLDVVVKSNNLYAINLNAVNINKIDEINKFAKEALELVEIYK